MNNNNNNNNITFIRLYATQAHGHKPYIQIHNTVINWEKKHPYTYMYNNVTLIKLHNFNINNALQTA